MKHIAVVLSGCGHKDGSEITEAVSSLIALSEGGAHCEVFAPDLDIDGIDHQNGTNTGKRNTLTESARIARGQIKSLSQLAAKDFDGVVFPGGYGAALHLCNFASQGSHCTAHADARRVIEEFYSQSKPIGAFCIAPALIACVLGSKGVTVTVGEPGEASREIEKMGAHHVPCAVDDYVTDRETKVITTPAYMYQAQPFQVFTGIRKAVRELLEMA